MKTFLCLVAFALAGCSLEKAKSPQNTDDKYRITMCFEKRIDLVWTTKYRPIADGNTIVVQLSDGRELRLSGMIIVEQTK